MWGAFNRSEDDRWSSGLGEEDDEEARPRRLAPPPDELEVRRALEAGLRPAPVYTIAWSG